MDLKLRQTDRIRVESEQQKAWVDVSATGYEGIAVEACTSYLYVEVRTKQGQVCTLYFPTKRHKKDADLGWWGDAEVVYAVNNVKA